MQRPKCPLLAQSRPLHHLSPLLAPRLNSTPSLVHETAAITDFTYGVADRGASIRVPHSFIKNDYRGYLEDRRPNSQGDPYQIASQILKTIDSVPKEFAKSAAA